METNKRTNSGTHEDDEGGKKRTRAVETNNSENIHVEEGVSPGSSDDLQVVYSSFENNVDSDTSSHSAQSQCESGSSANSQNGNSDSDSDSEDDGDADLSFSERIQNKTKLPVPGEPFGPKYEVEEDSIVLYEAPTERFEHFVYPDGFVPVVVDPKIAEDLRQEQIDGIKFMFNHFNDGKGCILAHEQGAGKSMTCVALIHTLLQQSIKSRRQYKPSIRKVVIVAPKTVVAVWEEEFRKWLEPNEHVVVTTICKPAQDEDTITKFLEPEIENQVLIISYETIKKFKYFFKIHPTGDMKEPLDLVIFDEVHRLKNSKSQLSKACHELDFKVKIGLTGTPVQNTLEELFRLIEIVQPFVLFQGTKCTEAQFAEKYVKRFSTGSLLKRQYFLTDEDEQRLGILKSIINPILQIRQNKVGVPKHDMIICGRLEKFQTKIYTKITGILEKSTTADKAKPNTNKRSENFWCTNITLLRNVCHHPVIARSLVRKGTAGLKALFSAPLEKLFKKEKKMGTKHQPFLAQKMKFIIALVHELSHKYLTDRSLKKITKLEDKERVVIVSNSTQVLEMVEKVLKDTLQIKCLSLKGPTSSKKRSENIKLFNDLSLDHPVFLLSSKAGGFGITLTGGNHLVMLDPDWNPANDEQAMARIWREGQKKPCYIYRLFSTGTVEEVIYKRQLTKKEIDRYVTENEFTKFEILREARGELFSYSPSTLSSIHDSINCTKPECYKGEPASSLNETAVQGTSVASTNQEHILLNSSLPVPGPSTSTFNGFSSFALPVDEDEEYGEGDEIECDLNVSSLAKWSHFENASQLPQGEDEIPILRRIWSYEQQDSVGITFTFYKKTDSKDRLTIDSASALIDHLLSPMPSTRGSDS